jgi:4-hydroxybenzoyl-CoA thioesterase
MSSADNREFSLPIRVYIEDTDAGGIVYYVNYLKFMERARTEMLRSYGYDKPAFLDDDHMFVVHSVSVNYRKSAKLDDQITATARIIKMARAYFDIEQKIYRDNELLCEGLVKVANVKRHSMRPAAIPAQVKIDLGMA